MRLLQLKKISFHFEKGAYVLIYMEAVDHFIRSRFILLEVTNIFAESK